MSAFNAIFITSLILANVLFFSFSLLMFTLGTLFGMLLTLVDLPSFTYSLLFTPTHLFPISPISANSAASMEWTDTGSPPVSPLFSSQQNGVTPNFPSSPGSNPSPLSAPSLTRNVYGLHHILLNLNVSSYWLNMGYWRNSTTFAAACESLAKLLGDELTISKNDCILDVGYGCGDQDIFYLKHYDCKHIMGVTSEYTQARVARARVRNLGLEDRIELYTGDATTLPIQVSANLDHFDKIISLDSAYHYNTRACFLETTFPLLKGGGRIGLADIILTTRELSRFNHFCFSILGNFMDIPLANMITSNEYQGMMEAIGYKDVSIECIEDDVFPGLTEFIERHRKQWAVVLQGNAKWLRFEMFRWALKYVYKERLLHFVIVTATKPVDVHKVDEQISNI